jgi:hypothetical protein
MDCCDCGVATVAFEVPPDLREYVPGEEAAVALCTRCLGLHPAPEGEATADPDFTAISSAFSPDNTGENGAIAMALLVGLMPTFALYRPEIEALTERVERAGIDPLLVLDRLAADPDTEPETDLRRRRRQLEQVLD